MFVFGCNMTHNANMISYVIVQFWHWVEWKKGFWGVLVECAGFLPAKPVQLMCGLNWRLFVLHHQQSCRNLWYTTPRLPAGFFLNGERSTMRSCLSESVRKMGRWVLERGGRVGDHGGGGGYLWICLRHLHPLFDTTGRRVSVRMCERGRHPQGWTLNPDFWRRDQTFKLHIWRVEGSQKKESGFQRERERRRDREKSCKEQKDGCHETHAASPPADCAHANEDGEGRFNVWGILVLGKGTFIYLKKAGRFLWRI